MKKTIILLIGIFFAVSGIASTEEKSYIDDKDGYVNVRRDANSSSPVIAKIMEGEIFVVFPESGVSWYRVNTSNNISGYVHKSRIKTFSELKVEIGSLFLQYGNPMGAEQSETNNELLFEYARKYPEIFVYEFFMSNPPIKQKLLAELESPVHDGIDIALTYERILTASDISGKAEIIKSLEVAASKAGITLPEKEFSLSDYFKFMGFELEETELATITNILGSAQINQSGDGADSYAAVCYRVPGKNITIYFESGEMGGGTTLLSYRVKTEATSEFPCGTSISKLLSQYNIGVLVLGERMDKVFAGLPKNPELKLGNRIVYSVSIPLTEEEVMKFGMSKEDFGHVFRDTQVTINLSSENAVLTGFSVYKVTTL